MSRVVASAGKYVQSRGRSRNGPRLLGVGLLVALGWISTEEAAAEILEIPVDRDAHTLERRSGSPGSGGAISPAFGNVRDADDLVLGCFHEVLSVLNARADCSKIFLDFQFSAFEASQLERATIQSVLLRIDTASPPVDVGDAFEISAADAAWSVDDPPTLSWSNQPDPVAAFSQSFVPAAGTMEFDVTSIVTGWLDGDLPNHGLVLGGQQDTADLFDGADVDQRAFFDSAESAGVGPRLVIDFVPLEEVVSILPTEDNGARLRILEVPPSPPMPTFETLNSYPSSRINVGCSVEQPVFSIATNCWNSFLLFDLPEDLEPGDLISATLRLSVFDVNPDAVPFMLTQAGDMWDPGALNYINQPMPAVGGSLPQFVPVPGATEIEVLVDVTAMVGDWLDGTLANHGFLLDGGDSSALPDPLNANGIVQFHSLEEFGGDPENQPELILVRVPEPSAFLLSVAALGSVCVTARLRRRSSRL